MRTERDRACANIIAPPHHAGATGPQAAALIPGDIADLRRFLTRVADSRDARGRRNPAVAVLCAAVAAVLTGARSLIAINEWIADAPQQVLDVLGFGMGEILFEATALRRAGAEV
ncbi:transposase family protein [Streptomyces sp. NBC_00378]|uniref:transposase family protein n=1 Tax=Streptomyces sp. NBC_00378 TaxID=2975732 RepID=UPI00224E8B9D|nr:transposase family protein [Streptomyces sp. NBC_00378]MCX5113461.1 transposase family protein [Streptomyces sp. NBC_00378]